MHDVPGEGFRLDGGEGAQSHMQRDRAEGHASLADLLEQRGGKMQTGCGRRDRAGGSRINRLVALGIVRPFVHRKSLDIGRQGDFAERVKFVGDIGRAGKTQPAMTFFVDPGDNGVEVRGFALARS